MMYGRSLAAAREEALLADQLHEVGDRLEQAERTRTVRPVAVLHPAEQLALEPRRVGEGEQEQVDHEERLDQADPPGLVHRRFTSTTSWPSPRACSSAARTVPLASFRERRARRRDRRVVRADLDLVARLDAARASVGRGELEHRLRPLELELRDALDRRPREERPVRDEPETRGGRRGRLPVGRGDRLVARASRRERRLLAYSPNESPS